MSESTMNIDLVFKLVFTTMFLCFAALMLYFQQRSKQGRKPLRQRVQAHNENEIPLLVLLRSVLGLIWYAGIALWFFAPHWIEWASLPLPSWLRWGGVGTAVLAAWLIAWSHQVLWAELGADFDPLLRLQPVPRLVTKGPYRWIRHPMYLAYLLMMVATALLSANALTGTSGIALILAVILLRTVEEEKRLTAQFGNAYYDYSKRTGRFLPRLTQGY